jgi:CMP-N,N'-diacetyllegionaminic acid synthase
MISAFIPARGGSKRIPGKNMMDFCGKPLVAWSIEQALSTVWIDETVVSSDDIEVLKLTNLYNVRGIQRKREYASDKSTLEQTLMWHIFENHFPNTDTFVILQPTSPLRKVDDIDKAIIKYKAMKRKSLASVCFEDDLFLMDSSYEPMTFEPHPRLLIGDYYRENGSIYIIDKETFKTHGRYAKDNLDRGIYEMQNWQGFEIDNPVDIGICEYFMRREIIL